MDFGQDMEVIGMEARIEMDGEDGHDASGLEREIDRLIGLLAADEEPAVVQSAMLMLVGIGPAAFGQLSQRMYKTADDRLRIRTIEVLGLSCQAHPEAVAILVSAWSVLVEPRAQGAIERALFATLVILILRHGVPQPEPLRGGRNGTRRAASSRARKVATGAVLPPPNEAGGS
jgi:hypothetical protein